MSSRMGLRIDLKQSVQDGANYTLFEKPVVKVKALSYRAEQGLFALDLSLTPSGSNLERSRVHLVGR